MKNALIFGAGGQDGAYLAELLLSKGYKVSGQFRSSDGSKDPTSLLPSSIVDNSNFRAFYGSVTNSSSTHNLVVEMQPDEIYYLASNHEVDFSLENYEDSRSINLDGLAGVLSALSCEVKSGRLFYASSSNIFYNTKTLFQNEQTEHSPGTLYGFCKSAAMSLIQMYRNQLGVFACSGILYNHESPRRKKFFLPRKIVSTAVAIKMGKEIKLNIGDLQAVRDWGYAGDFVRAMWMMLQADYAQDYVIGTGVTHSVEWVINFVFQELGLDWRQYIICDPSLMRKHDSKSLKADITKIKKDLGWKPETEFKEVLKMMIKRELLIQSL